MQLQVFEHKNLGNVRVIGDNENPLFCLGDVCKILELESINKVANAIKAEFEQGGELNSTPLQTRGGVQQATFITEPQLYFVLMRSDKPKARAFRQWVVNEVLHIRKQGHYLSPNMESTLINELRDSNLNKDSLKRENESLKDELLQMQRELLNFYKISGRRRPKEHSKENAVSVSEISKTLGVSKSSVRKYIKGERL